MTANVTRRRPRRDSLTNPGVVIEDLDFRASTFQSMLSILTDDLEGRIAKLHRDRNEHTTVANLPTELLIRILELSAQGPKTQSLCLLSRLRRVCSHWNDTIEQTPSLWSHISFSPWDTPWAVSTALAKATVSPGPGGKYM